MAWLVQTEQQGGRLDQTEHQRSVLQTGSGVKIITSYKSISLGHVHTYARSGNNSRMFGPCALPGSGSTMRASALLSFSRPCALRHKVRCKRQYVSQPARRNSGSCRQCGRPARADASGAESGKEERQLVSRLPSTCFRARRKGCPCAKLYSALCDNNKRM